MPTKMAVHLILDTDMSVDVRCHLESWPQLAAPMTACAHRCAQVDDIGALCIAHALADLGEAHILAVVHGTGLSSGVGAIAAINRWYDREVPTGAYRGAVGAEAIDAAMLRGVGGIAA